MNAFDFFFEHSSKLDKQFVSGEQETISFRQLYADCLIFANHLSRICGENNNILLIAPNSVFFITAYLAILKSGNVVVPLNPEIENRSLAYIQERCGSRYVFITEQIQHKFDFKNCTLFTESTLHPSALTPSALKPSALTPSASLAEIIFTSGSTGVPKGVMISHGNLVANTTSILEYLHLTQQDTMLVVLPFYYCYGLSLLHTHLRVGGSIVLNNMFMMLGGVIRDLKKYNCTGFAGVPSHFQVLLRKSESFKTSVFPSLRYVTQAGGKLHNAFILEFLKAFPDIEFNVMYGQTEATARLCWLPPEKLLEKPGSCGKAIPGVELMISNENDEAVKPGETGEVLARGENIMQGYYRDTDATNETLKNGWLHTGDLAEMDHEGFIFLSGRIKEILKVGGRRISPKEIEEAIVSMPDVIDCSIEGAFDNILGETMKAHVVIREGSEVGTDHIKKWCAKYLPLYKIPQIVMITNEVKISATGKKIKE